jgi:23S rRNA (adenine2030-N6)-methyltransferase
MFSYRHGFHAGNHADVLKHLVLVQLLKQLALKDKPFWFVDTHAGAGAYALDTGFAAKSGEHDTGITRLWPQPDLPPALREYVGQVRAFNGDGALRRYPGSPQLALQLSREQDRLRLFELHSTEAQVVQDYFRGEAGKRVKVQVADGFGALKSVLPPPPRRALVLIDPSYEDKEDYKRVVTTMRDALERFATGTYAIWYPQVVRRESHDLPDKLQRLAPGDWLHVWLKVSAPPDGGLGLYGSGMFILNPPWKLEAALRPVLAPLVELLGQDGQAAADLRFRQT